MAVLVLVDGWLELVIFYAGGQAFALETDQVISMQKLSNSSQEQLTAIPSLAAILHLPTTILPNAGRPRVLEIKYQASSLLIMVEEPVTIHRITTDAIHSFPETVRCRLRQPAVWAAVVCGEQLVILLDTNQLTLATESVLTEI